MRKVKAGKSPRRARKGVRKEVRGRNRVEGKSSELFDQIELLVIIIIII